MALPETGWLLWLLGATLLALVASAGYLLGHRRPRVKGRNRATDRPEIERASAVVDDLEGVARRLRKAIAHHARAVRKFNTRLGRYERRAAVSRHELSDRAEEMLKPSARLTADISHAYAELVQQMTHLSTFAELRSDPLTGAANRRVLDESLTALLSAQTRHSAPLSLAMVDVDFFKQFNDARSLMQGDRLLQELADVLRATLRQQDVVARYGGEEFVVVMPHTESYLAMELAERMRTVVQSKMPITVSIGLAVSAHGDTPATLFGRADAALTLAKSAGRNCVYFHEGTMGRIVGIKGAPGAKPTAQSGKRSISSARLEAVTSKRPPVAEMATTTPCAGLGGMT
jgi:diguanylate cyclase (GGDEF)-like protein